MHHEKNPNPFIEAFKFCVRGVANFINRKSKGSTSKLARNHVIETSESNLVSLMGGKWTSYRAMGEETVDEILNQNLLEHIGQRKTIDFNLIGSFDSNKEMIGDFDKYTRVI